MRIILSFMIVVYAITGCKSKFEFSRKAYILGNNDIATVNASNDIPAIRKATVLISTTKAEGSHLFCSGTLVKNSQGVIFVITNHHCFATTDPDGNTTKDLILTACTKTKVYFDFIDGKTAGTQSRNCLVNSLRTDPSLDIAVFQLDGTLPSDAISLDFYQEDPTGREAVIFHHPARMGGYAKSPEGDASLPMAAITSADCKIIGPFNADELSLDPILQVSLRHSCDLDHGSSGSALIDKETKKIVGINWGGVTINDSSKKIERKDNTATGAPYAVSFLNSIPYSLNVFASKNNVSKSKSRASGCTLSEHAEGRMTILLLFPLLWMAARQFVSNCRVQMVLQTTERGRHGPKSFLKR